MQAREEGAMKRRQTGDVFCRYDGRDPEVNSTGGRVTGKH